MQPWASEERCHSAFSAGSRIFSRGWQIRGSGGRKSPSEVQRRSPEVGVWGKAPRNWRCVLKIMHKYSSTETFIFCERFLNVHTPKHRGKKLVVAWSGPMAAGAPYYGTNGTMVNPALNSRITKIIYTSAFCSELFQWYVGNRPTLVDGHYMRPFVIKLSIYHWWVWVLSVCRLASLQLGHSLHVSLYLQLVNRTCLHPITQAR